MASNVPVITFTQSGVVVPAESAILTGVQADINAAFGGDVNPSLETPQGQLATSTSAIIADKNAQIAEVVNQVDPAYSTGRFQDGIGRIYFITRIPGQGTVVAATCTGAAGVIIPAGTQAKDLDGNVYSSTADAIIGGGGSVIVPFVNTAFGPIACPAHNLTTIFKAIPGWDSIDNEGAGVLGRLIESRNDFENRRRSSVAANAQHSPGAILGAVLSVSGVSDAYVYSNNTDAAVDVGETDYSVAANSFYIAVVGGQSADIGAAIFSKMPGGIPMQGTTSVTVKDMSYPFPQPQYTIKYQIPDPLPIKFKVTLQANPLLPSDIVAQTKTSIVRAFTGEDGGQRARIGSQVVAGRFYAGIYAISPHVNILDLKMGASPVNKTSITAGIDEVPTISESDIEVIID